ncbi:MULTISPECIES: ABC transporter ATP-binding protein [Thalassospira]|jgi:branched-chain amino acid transport system ATP-binding protein|uniref:Branched-chain amino acid ABC transporter substrate-binding protein n=1 Tax=Thalassospira profundimaris TaxID=502049 RepID=A0A367V2D3_9PROT|nr:MULTISPECIES: ABC transporter ATP-binding protein [Thalassospira]MBR9900537.1 ABC transporter ATP-binding protein [Rhodospirillales bacterium]KZB69676.1 ABC transporter ATP-binding protein [Thalassospira sp. MCCC 1A01148]MBC44956.1 ABC transporter ATP-binding protein [Thalassospira sp.]MBO6809217.1 ABC transporter ATP-binding protein [Thalassospira sp.]MBO6841176.1 ABC transporter ATP-binding protein [Thalassospira sp.]|tara:strand:+ start:8418 stop:9167 length:750 start_codon:yes stop_codon:yes gene_type:complete
MSDAILSLSDVTKQFGSLLASDSVTLDLQPGEIHALIGPNGAGKSTLIKQIAGEIKSDRGDIHFDGQNINEFDAVTRSRMGLARTFQVSSLMPEFSVLQNVMLARQSVSGKVFRFFKPVLGDKSLVDPAMAQLERVGLADRAQMRAADISHGERRQLEMAVALALEPKAFLLDEPMAGMGPEGSKRLTGFLDGLRAQAPILLVEHDMDAVFALADRISVLVYGRIIATGTVDEIRGNDDVKRAYLGEDA